MTEENIIKSCSLKNIPATHFSVLNDLRKKRGYTWAELITHLSNHSTMLHSILDREIHPDLCTTKSEQTVSVLLPKWCDNIANNLPFIQKHGDISQLVCATRHNNNCIKLDKLKQMYLDPVNQYEISELSEKCKLPIHGMNFYLQQVHTYSFPPVAGSEVCTDCDNYIHYNKPALIIGGGPSLYKYGHLDLLKKYGFKGDIFVVGKVLKEVLEHGIIPTYVGGLDAEEFDTTFFDHEIVDTYYSNITALFGTNVHPTTVKRWKGNMYFFSGHIGTPNISHIVHLLTHTSTISVAGNIGSCLCNLASFLGYNPIVTIGLDLSFPTKKDMELYYPHAKKEDWNRSYILGGKERPMYKRGWNNHFRKQFYYDSVFESYADSHLSWIKALHHVGIKTINCSEQGALYKSPVINMKFEEYLKSQQKG